jgi:hypothetical protein
MRRIISGSNLSDAHFRIFCESLLSGASKTIRKSIDLSERLRLREIPLAKNLALLC